MNEIVEFDIFMQGKDFSNYTLCGDRERKSIVITFLDESDALSFKLKNVEKSFAYSSPDLYTKAEWRYDPDYIKEIESLLDPKSNETDDYLFIRDYSTKG